MVNQPNPGPGAKLMQTFKAEVFFDRLGCCHFIEPATHPINSLTRVVTVRHHWIHPFVAGVRGSVKGAGSSFCVDLSGFEVFVNEEGTRTFVGLRAISGTYRTDYYY